ncbi:MAG: hypothetical protein ACLQLO_18355 [Mycobacterium sp.]
MSAAPGLMTLVESYFEAWNSRDPDAVAVLISCRERIDWDYPILAGQLL